MVKLVYKDGKETKPQIELTREEWDEYRRNSFIKGVYIPKPTDKIVKIGKYKFYLDDG